MLNILHTKIAFADWVKENILNKIATKIVYKGEGRNILKLRSNWHFRLERHTLWSLHMMYIVRNITKKWCAGIYRKRNIRTGVTNMACGVNRY